MKIKEFKYKGVVLAKYIQAGMWNDGLSFYSKDKDYIQVGTWNYPKGKELLAHVHNRVKRNIDRTQEVLYVKKGKLKAAIYTLRGKLISYCLVKAGDILILFSCGHGYSIMEDDTEVLEIKNGPYLGPTTDRRRI